MVNTECRKKSVHASRISYLNFFPFFKFLEILGQYQLLAFA